MGVQVAFDYGVWVTRYPEFSGVDPILVNEYFTEATMYHRNDGSGPVNNPQQQVLLLNMVTAHICQLNAPLNGQPSTTQVGRISSASEGSVSVSTELDLAPGALAQFFGQTKYGLAYWSATSQFRTMRYRPGQRRLVNPWYRGGTYW